MQNNIFKLNSNIKVHRISSCIKKLINIYNIANDLLKTISISCLNNNKKIILFFNPGSQFCFNVNEEIEDAFISFVKSFLNKEKLDLFVSFEILNVYGKICKNEISFYKLFNYLNWPSSKKGFDYFSAFKRFSIRLKNLIKNKKISLQEACLFHTVFKSDYDDILSMIPGSLTFSETNILIRNLSEYAKNNCNKAIHIFSILNNNKFDSSNDFLDLIFKLRFPIFSKYSDKFKKFLDVLNFPKQVEILYDRTFEKNDYTLNIKFKNLKDLDSKIKKVGSSIENKLKNNIKDLFNRDDLFNDEN